MTAIPQLIEYIGTWLAAAALLTFIFRIWKRTFSLRLAFTIICGVVPFIRYGGESVAGYVLGVYGSLSIVTIVLVGIKAAENLTLEKYITRDERGITYTLLAAAGLVLYSTSLGLTGFSAYRSGLGSPSFVVGLFGVAVLLTFLRLRLPALLIAFAVAAFQLRLLESVNLWDYLIDPLLFFFALVLSVNYWIRQLVKLVRNP
ncbi:MAG: hypothetical protein JO053_11830 [Acidobacteria bacterium]|nr:hypothetical protein [Acidobacteriota bacterium]